MDEDVVYESCCEDNPDLYFLVRVYNRFSKCIFPKNSKPRLVCNRHDPYRLLITSIATSENKVAIYLQHFSKTPMVTLFSPSNQVLKTFTISDTSDVGIDKAIDEALIWLSLPNITFESPVPSRSVSQ